MTCELGRWEDEGMTNEAPIHHMSTSTTHVPVTLSAWITDDWSQVTCGECKLEKPADEKAPEYRMSEGDRAAVSSLAASDRARMLEVRVAKARAVEDMALDCLVHWSRTFGEAVQVREAAENALGVALADVRGAGVPEVGSELSDAQRAAQGFGRKVVEAFTLNAPVNAVDIRTGVEEDEGMTNLSDAAKNALINAKHSGEGAQTGAIGPVMRELHSVGMIGTAGGMTIKGANVREKLLAARLDDLFGAM